MLTHADPQKSLENIAVAAYGWSIPKSFRILSTCCTKDLRWSQYFDQMISVFWPDDSLCKSAMHMFDSRLSIAQSDQVNLEMFIAVSNWFRPFKGHIHHAFWLSRRAFVVYGTIEAPVLHVIGQQKKDLRWGTSLTCAGPTWLEWPKKLSRLEWCCTCPSGWFSSMIWIYARIGDPGNSVGYHLIFSII